MWWSGGWDCQMTFGLSSYMWSLHVTGLHNKMEASGCSDSSNSFQWKRLYCHFFFCSTFFTGPLDSWGGERNSDRVKVAKSPYRRACRMGGVIAHLFVNAVCHKRNSREVEFFSFPLENPLPPAPLSLSPKSGFQCREEKASTNSIMQLNSGMALEIC